MLTVTPYTPDQRSAWDEFVRRSKNGVFLFCRDYMDYHADRFADSSLLFFEGDRIAAVLPANHVGDEWVSHGGLTFGGVVTDERMTIDGMRAAFDLLLDHLRQGGVRRLVYKPVPHIYHRLPAEEDLYLLFVKGARLIRRDLSTTIAIRHPLPYAKGRKWSINKARKADVGVEPSLDFEAFMAIEEYVLRKYHGTKPVHSAAEIQLLAERFPENIRLFGAFREGDMLAGVIVYADAGVAHAQYISVDRRRAGIRGGRSGAGPSHPGGLCG